MVAEEHETDTFYGGWTYDAPIVDEIITYLQQEYCNSAGTVQR